MKTIGVSRIDLLKYFDLLCKAAQITDEVGFHVLERELQRVKGKILFLESLNDKAT